jgi:O-antigen/teichoic acid export membrane protein
MKREKTGTTRSVVSNWAGQVATIASGFILPRLLNDTLGTAELGVWDIGWTARSVITMSSFGMGSSSNHYAARFQASGEWDRLSHVLSATIALVIYTLLLALLVTVGCILVVPFVMRNDTAELVASAQIVVAAMGFAAGLKMVQVVYGGSMAGIGRFDLLNLVEIVGDVVMLVTLFATLWLGGGLRIMAMCVAGNEIIRWWGKRYYFYQLCPQVRIRPRWTDWKMFREVAAYGTKTLGDALADIIVAQGTIAILAFYHGAAVVPLFARSRNLIRVATRFVLGYARVLVSKAGELYESGDRTRLAGLLVEGTRTGLYLALPVATVFLIMGSPLLRRWMGDEFADPTVLMILAAGYLPFHVQRSTYHFLLGIGKHGRAALATLIASVVTVGLCFVFVGVLGWGVIGAAIAVAVPVGFVNLVVIPWVGCRVVGIPVLKYWSQCVGGPVMSVLPFAGVLMASRLMLPERPYVSLAVGMAVGGPVLLVVYWRSALPAGLKTRLQRLVFDRLRRKSAGGDK